MINGIINVYKEAGYTSHDVVARLRGILKQKKIGHTGTLDPDAQGVLPVCLGKATRLCDMLTDENKTYEAVLYLGITTDTQDMTGQIRQQKEPTVSNGAIIAAIRTFEGEYMQIPPMYSALKVNGKKLYELAREGKEIERKPRKVHFYEILILDIQMPRVKLRVTCSKGTYIRTLCNDIGEKLGCGGCMESLLRTQVGSFTAAKSKRLDEIEEIVKKDNLTAILYSIESMFQQYSDVTMKAEGDKRVYNGNVFETMHLQNPKTFKDQECVRVFDSQGVFVGIYRHQINERLFKLVKLFCTQ